MSDSPIAELARALKAETIAFHGFGDADYILAHWDDANAEMAACLEKDLRWQAAIELEHLLAIYEQRYKDVKLLSVNPDGRGQFVAELQSGMAAFIAEYLAQLLKADGAPNFVQVEADHPELGPLTFSIERRFGRAPAVQLAEAKARIVELEGLLAKKPALAVERKQKGRKAREPQRTDMALYRAYRYYLGATVYEIEAESPEDAYAKLEFAVHTADTADNTVRMTHEAMLPALNEISTHVFKVADNGCIADDPDYVIHKARDGKLDELVKTAFDPQPDRKQP